MYIVDRVDSRNKELSFYIIRRLGYYFEVLWCSVVSFLHDTIYHFILKLQIVAGHINISTKSHTIIFVIMDGHVWAIFKSI